MRIKKPNRADTIEILYLFLAWMLSLILVSIPFIIGWVIKLCVYEV